MDVPDPLILIIPLILINPSVLAPLSFGLSTAIPSCHVNSEDLHLSLALAWKWHPMAPAAGS